jgi:nicotinamidase-related amidase
MIPMDGPASLEVVLRSGDYRKVLVAGGAASMCVEGRVRDLGRRDHETIVAEDACADFDDERHRALIASMAFGFASIAVVDDVKATFHGRRNA